MAAAKRVSNAITAQAQGALAIAVIAPLLLLAVAALGQNVPWYGWAIAAAWVWGSLVYAHDEWRKVKARRHGIAGEAIAQRQAGEALEAAGIRIVARVLRARGLGDIDLVVNIGHGRMPIEIKSYRRFAANEARASKALAQTYREMHYLHAREGILWLPEARHAPTRCYEQPHHTSVRVVTGPAHYLARELAA